MSAAERSPYLHQSGRRFALSANARWSHHIGQGPSIQHESASALVLPLAAPAVPAWRTLMTALRPLGISGFLTFVSLAAALPSVLMRDSLTA